MSKLSKLSLITGVLLMTACIVNAKNKVKDLPTIETKDLEFTLPAEFYGVQGVETEIYLDNLILTQKPERYRLSVKPKIGKIKKGCWSFKPKRVQKKSRTLEFGIRGLKTNLKKKIQLNIAPKDAGKGKELRLLIIGDSLTAGGEYPKEIARLMEKRGNPKLIMLGSQKKGKGIAYEGYGGWTWKSYMSKYSEKIVHYTKKGSSPFIFTDKNGKAELNVNRYFDDACKGLKPNAITILLGINDCFKYQNSLPDREAVQKGIGEVLKKSDILIKALREAAPEAIIGICLTTPPNSREEAFFANYKGAFHRWTWKQVQHLLVQAEIKHFGDREKDNIYIIPTELNVDPVDGYPTNNGVHLNVHGYSQIASTIYCWLKWQFYNKKIAK